MLKQIQDFFRQHLISTVGNDADREQALRLAVAALLIEVTHLDHEVTPEEKAAVDLAVRRHMGLSGETVAELLQYAERERADSTDYYQFTLLINREYDAARKVELIELMWRIAYADDALHRYEEHLIRKIAELLYVPHRAFVAAKHRARQHG
jgi:uncharacterized tellurite resistance protein B-like protein